MSREWGLYISGRQNYIAEIKNNDFSPKGQFRIIFSSTDKKDVEKKRKEL